MSDTPLNSGAQALEIQIIIDQIEQGLFTPYGKEFISALSFYTDPEVVKRKLQEVIEARDAITFEENLPFRPLENIYPFIAAIQPEEAFLEVEDFLKILDHLTIFSEIHSFFKKRKDKFPRLFFYAEGITPLDSLVQLIKKNISPQGEIYDNASPALKDIRQQIREIEASVKRQLQRLVKKYKEYIQDNIVTLRDGRLVLAIQDIHYHKVPGIVHGMSGSGKTYFIEPLEVLQTSNHLQDLRLKERKEIVAILRKLTHEFRQSLSVFQYNLENLGHLDFIFAKAKYAIRIKANMPEITDKGYFSIQNARHPLLIQKLGYERVVPLQVFLGDYFRILVITGPNAGGKTVALKTIGLVIAMTQMGILPPVEEGTELSLVSGLYVDIGDKQSIEQDLSTFSSHVANIKQILDDAPMGSLVLLDELGTATDPEEGAALSMAVMEYLLKRKMLAIITTHLGQIKSFAAETEGIENGSMEFDQNRLQPKYSLQIGVPGASYAFEIAKRLGLPDALINRAKEFLGEEKHSMEQLIVELNKKIQYYNEKLQYISVKESEVKALEKILEKRSDGLKEERRKIKQETMRELDEYLRKSKSEVESLIKELKKKGAEQELIAKSRQILNAKSNDVESALESLQEQEEFLDSVSVGQYIKLKGIDRIGKVISEPNERGRLWADFDGIKMQVQLKQLGLPDETELAKLKKEETGIESVNPAKNMKVGPELDLRGLEAQEAVERTNEYLTNALSSGWDEVRIIHGKGTGVLRREINKFLGKDKRVEEKRLGRWGEGDTGVTIVKLRRS